MQPNPLKNITMLIRYSAPYSVAEEQAGPVTQRLRAGIIRCNIATLFGQARLYGRNLTFVDFVEDEDILQQHNSTDAILSPLAAALYALEQNAAAAGSRIAASTLTAQLGYMEPTNIGNNRAPPTPQRFAETMWNGATHMAASVSMLSRTTDTEYNTTAYATGPGFVHHILFFYIVIGLVCFWGFGLIIVSVMFLRPTFCDTMGSYATALLFVQRPDLVAGLPAGPAEENPKLREKFIRVRFTDWRHSTGSNP